MFCTVNYSKGNRKWYVAFYDCNGLRNNRKAEYFDCEIDANNRVSELMVDENIRFVQLSFDQRIKAVVLSMLHEAEDTKTYTDCQEYRNQGFISALEELVDRFEF